MVRTPIGTAGSSARMARIASIPPMPGIFRSIRMRSGCSHSAAATASAPCEASPTTSKRPSAARMCLMPSRKSALSSARRTLTVILPSIVRGVVGVAKVWGPRRGHLRSRIWEKALLSWAGPARRVGSTPQEVMMSTQIATKAARVLIVDDQTLFRTGLARLLDEDPRVEVVGQAVDGTEAVKAAAELKPDVILMDLKMPGLDGAEATRRIIAEHPEIKVLILSTFDADSYVLQALRAGASGYVLKDSQPAAIVSSILAVISGERVMANAVANRVLDLLSGTATPKEFYDGLTGREIEILKLLATGLANKQIARRLDISEKTVRNHVSHMYEKLQIYDRSQAVLYAVRKGLVEP